MNSTEETGGEMHPFRLFISHKVSEHGESVRELKRILSLNNALDDKLKIYVSSEAPPGIDWVKTVHSELDSADLLLYIYCFSTPPAINDWCNYETGYYAKTSDRLNLVTLVPEKEKPPSPLQCYQRVELNEYGIKKLLRRIYVQEKIYPQLFDHDNSEKLEKMIGNILKIFNPLQKPKALSPRIWITLKEKHIDALKKGELPLPDDCTITGETEAAVRFNYDARGGKEITLKELKNKAEIKGGLPLFVTVLSDTMEKILNDIPGPWKVPPVKVLKSAPPNLLVPAYMHRMANGDRKFEFVVSVPPICFEHSEHGGLMMRAYNLFIVSWHFRWRVIEQYLEKFRILCQGGKQAIDAAKLSISKLKVDMSAVFLDSQNRRLQFPGDVTRNFKGEDRIAIEQIVKSETGIWSKIMPVFETACDEVDIDAVVHCLEQMQNINKTCMLLTLKLLKNEVDNKLEGEMPESSGG